MHETDASLGVALFRKHDLVTEVRVPRREVLEQRLVVDVALGAHAEIKPNRLTIAARKHAAQNRPDWREPRAAGDQQHRADVLVPQVGNPERPRHPYPLADFKMLGHETRGAAARHVADLEDEHGFAR